MRSLTCVLVVVCVVALGGVKDNEWRAAVGKKTQGTLRQVILRNMPEPLSGVLQHFFDIENTAKLPAS